MGMKYFRLLYGGTGRHFVHFGVLEDSETGETFTFLYLRGEKKHVGQRHSVSRLFLFPEHIDLAVLGSADEETLRVFSELTEGTRTDTLIANAKCKFANRERFPEIGKVIVLEDAYETESAGWLFRAEACSDGTVALMHGLAAGRSDAFDDCVMSVKALRRDARCQTKAAPDGYGCALGCALHRDHDLCRCCGKDAAPAFCAGTLLFGGGDENERKNLRMIARRTIGKIRFFGLADGAAFGPAGAPDGMEETMSKKSGSAMTGNRERTPGDGFRRYYIGLEDELDDSTIAALCRGGWHQRPVILREGEGICCSGLLRYVQ